MSDSFNINEYMDEDGDIYICPMTYEDIDDIVRWRNSDEVKKYFIYRGEFNHDNQVAWLKNHVETGEVAQMIIYEKKSEYGENDRKVGCVYIRDIDKKNNKGEYGVFIGEADARGRGIGTKVAKLMLRYGFEKLGLHRIYLRVLEGNERAVKSYEHAGFEKEGFLKDDVFVDGEYLSVTWMAALCPQSR